VALLRLPLGAFAAAADQPETMARQKGNNDRTQASTSICDPGQIFDQSQIAIEVTCLRASNDDGATRANE